MPCDSTITLSVIVPVFNEERTIDALLERLMALPISLDVIVVNDASTDSTAARLEHLQFRLQHLTQACQDPSPSSESLTHTGASLGQPAPATLADAPSDLPQPAHAPAAKPNTGPAPPSTIRVIHHAVNRGKGAAVRTGFAAAHGQVVVIQDADLEYDPEDLPRLLQPILVGKTRVVYGSRFLPEAGLTGSWRLYRLVNRGLTLLGNLLLGLRLTDMETCYKMIHREVLQQLTLTEDGFGIEPELTFGIAQLGEPIFELPVRYRRRSASEGKKIGWRDGVRTLWCLLRFGLARWNRRRPSRHPR